MRGVQGAEGPTPVHSQLAWLGENLLWVDSYTGALIGGLRVGMSLERDNQVVFLQTDSILRKEGVKPQTSPDLSL